MVNAPSPRADHAAVWTGRHMLVWGGGPPCSGCWDIVGGLYDPSADAWTLTSTAGHPPSARSAHSGVWTGAELLVWAGAPATATGGRYCATCGELSWWKDQDLDGHGSPSDVKLACVQPAGYSAVGDDCNDANGDVFPGALEQCDGLDNDCDGTVDRTAPPAEVMAGVRVERESAAAKISWPGDWSVDYYDLVAGDVGVLLNGGGDFTAATTRCLVADSPATSFTDAASTPVGVAWWYLARPTNCAGPGTYDSGGAGQAGGRDGEINASPAACP